MIGVSLLAIPCGYVGWQAKIVTDRKAFLEDRYYLPGESTPYAVQPRALRYGAAVVSFMRTSAERPIEQQD